MCKNKAGANWSARMKILENARISLDFSVRFVAEAVSCVLQLLSAAGFFTKQRLSAQGLCRKKCRAAQFLPLL
jgi:hypothetical protein